ncbi:hypothetical protein FQR65_LT18961 [Abscondita terminalis]|nr:hypothetical protein FQR65_LT18961 [Abscondita terminalis]
MGSIAFTNLPILFAVAIAISFTGESGVAALTAIIGFLTFNALQFAFLTELPDVRWKNVDIPGRNIVEGAKLFTKKDYENKKSKSQNEEEKRLKAIEIIKYVGGSENITGVDACASRLRISLKDQNLVDKESIMNLVRWKNVDIPGRNIVEGAKLFTKKDYENKKSKSQNEEEKRLKAIEIIKYVGGSENITGVDACASRLRISLKDQNLVDKESIMNLGGCKGIMLKNNYLQAVYGAEQEILKHLIKEEIKI